MRIIGGTMRGTKLYTLEGENTRPTLDRVKESLFNILNIRLQEAVVLDLFSGSGAIGLESISRGAEKAVLCDSSKEAFKIISSNVEKTRATEKIKKYNLDYEKCLKVLGDENYKFDIVFLDPPYESEYYKKSLDKIYELNLLAEDAIVILETDDRDRIISSIDDNNYYIYDERKYGRATLIFLNRKG